jgi:hypothetical protein
MTSTNLPENQPLDPSIRDQTGGKSEVAPLRTAGVPGTAIYGGFIVENERDARLTGTEKYTTYSNVLVNTAIVGAGVRYFLNLVSKAKWRVEPASEDTAAVEMAERIEEIMDSMATPWHRVVRRAAMYRFYGFSLQEWTMRVDEEDGAMVYDDIAPRPQRTIERWDTDRTGRVLGVVQRSAQDGESIYLPRGKLIYMVDDTLDDSPEGLGLFRHLVSRSVTLQRYELLEAWGFERDLRGTPIGRAPLAELERMRQSGELTDAQVSALRAPIETFVRNALKGKDTGLVVDSEPHRGIGETETPINLRQYDIELLRGETTSQPDMARAIERLNREMARVLGVEHLLLGSSSQGSFALSKDKTETFALIVTGTLQEIQEVMENDFLDPLWELNGWDEELRPKFVVEQIQFRDIEQITNALNQLAKAGAPILPDDPAINEIRDQMGISHQPEREIDLLAPNPLNPLAAAVPGAPPLPEEPTPKEEPEDKDEV